MKNTAGSDHEQLSRIIEGALFAAGEALSVERLLLLFDDQERPDRATLLQVLDLLQQASADRGYQLVEVASGWRFQVRAELAPWVNKLWEEKPQRYSRAVLETLALIAYRQPITRGDIEDVRGVSVSTQIIKTLAEREWIKVVGHRDVPGRPALYATTRQFLDYFGLTSLEQLPSLSELQDFESFADPLLAVESGNNQADDGLPPQTDAVTESASSDASDKHTTGQTPMIGNGNND